MIFLGYLILVAFAVTVVGICIAKLLNKIFKT